MAGGPLVSSPSKAQEEECFIFTEAFLSAGSLISPLHIFGNPAVGWIYGAERSPWEPERTPGSAGFSRDRTEHPSPLTPCLAEASGIRHEAGVRVPRLQTRRELPWGPPWGQTRIPHYATASSVPFSQQPPRSTHLAQPDPALQLTQREERQCPERETDRQWLVQWEGQAGKGTGAQGRMDNQGLPGGAPEPSRRVTPQQQGSRLVQGVHNTGGSSVGRVPERRGTLVSGALGRDLEVLRR